MRRSGLFWACSRELSIKANYYSIWMFSASIKNKNSLSPSLLLPFFIFVWTVLFVSPGNLLKWQHKYTSRNWYFSAFYGIRLCQVEHYVQIIFRLHFEQNVNKQIRVVQFGRMWSELPLPNINLIQFRFIFMFWENQWHISLCVSSIKS